jgi:Mg-chelatase subunit ChlD
VIDEERRKIEARKASSRPGARPLADGCFTVELDLSHFVRVHEERKQKTLLIIVADRSGSMKGTPWQQVLSINLI